MYAQSESPVEDSWRFTWSEWCSKGVWNLKVSNTTQNRELLWVRLYWCSSVRNLLKTEITERTVKRNDGGGEVCVANRCLQTYSVLLHNINRWKRYVACTNVILLLDININRCTIYWCIKNSIKRKSECNKRTLKICWKKPCKKTNYRLKFTEDTEKCLIRSTLCLLCGD